MVDYSQSNKDNDNDNGSGCNGGMSVSLLGLEQTNNQKYPRAMIWSETDSDKGLEDDTLCKRYRAVFRVKHAQ